MIVEVNDSSQVSAARRAAATLAKDRGFDEGKAGRVALIATELATNLIKHAEGGEIVVDAFADASGTGIELVALDKGRGITDIAHAFSDGMSTVGSFGNGLGAIRRQADQLNIFSQPNRGTAIAARVADGAARQTPVNVILGAIVEPYPGETICGDAWSFGAPASGPTLLMADGSGHGAFASSAAQAAVRTFQERMAESCSVLAQDIHRALASTRGAAIAVARIDRQAQLVRFAGLGNIAGAVIAPDGKVRRMVSHNGIAGHVAPRIAEFAYPYVDGSIVVLHSDGISTKWDMDVYPGLAVNHPSILAGVLFRDFRRRKDDASVVAIRV